MSTLLRQLDAKVIELINADRPADVPEAQDARTFSIAGEKDLPVISVRRISTVPVRDPLLDRDIPDIEDTQQLRTVYFVECYGKGDAVDRPLQATDALATWVWKACGGRRETSGDGPTRLFYQIHVRGPFPNVEQSDHPYDCTRVELVVFHQVRADDPEAWE